MPLEPQARSDFSQEGLLRLESDEALHDIQEYLGEKQTTEERKTDRLRLMNPYWP